MIADDRGPVSKFVASIGPLTTLFGLCPACKAVHFFIFNAQQFGYIADPTLYGDTTLFFTQTIYKPAVPSSSLTQIRSACPVILNTIGQSVGDPRVELPADLVFTAFRSFYGGTDKWQPFEEPTCRLLLKTGTCMQVDGHINSDPVIFGYRWVADHIIPCTSSGGVVFGGPPSATLLLSVNVYSYTPNSGTADACLLPGNNGFSCYPVHLTADPTILGLRSQFDASVPTVLPCHQAWVFGFWTGPGSVTAVSPLWHLGTC